MNTEERVEQVTKYLRGLSATLADMMLEDAADLIDELYAATFVLAEESEGANRRRPKPALKRKKEPGETFGETIKAAIRKKREQELLNAAAHLPPSS